MSLISAVRSIIGTKTAKVVLEVSANPKVEGEMVVVVRPLVGPVADNASEELKQLCAALATPIKIIGTPDVIEQEFAAAVSEQADHRSSWDSRAAELEAMIAAGARTDAKKPDSKAESKPKTEAPEKAESDTPASKAPSKPFSL